MHKALFVSDVHIPRHDPRMVTMLFDVIKKWKPNSIDLLGDIDDADETSRWAADTVDEAPMKASLSAVNDFLDDIRKAAPRADFHFHDGNHGWTRHMQYVDKNARALSGLITPELLYNIEKNGITWHTYQAPPVQRFGSLHAHHGIAISKNSGESVRKDIDDMDVSIIRGHSHRQGVYKKTTMRGSLEGYEIGHMCDLKKMDYMTHHNWQAGFATGLIDGDQPHIQLVPIYDYVCYIDGKRVEG